MTDRLTRGIQYLNLAEMRAFCAKHALPLSIHVEGADGRLRRTSDRDRKDVVLRRILDFARRGKRSEPTVYRRVVTSDAPLPSPVTARTKIHYGQYEKKNAAFLGAMQRLTAGAFKTGMIARLVLRDFWTAGEAPTLKRFAVAWVRATAAHTKPRPEGAYLVDLWQGEAGPGWKRVRVQRAREARRELDRLIKNRQ